MYLTPHFGDHFVSKVQVHLERREPGAAGGQSGGQGVEAIGAFAGRDIRARDRGIACGSLRPSQLGGPDEP